MTGFEIDADAVEAHGKLLSGQLTGDLQQAVDASHISLGSDVLGLICQVYSLVFDEELQEAQNLVGKLPDAMEATGAQLISTASTYRGVDGDNAAGLGQVYP
ncbi:MAG: type VII secretion target [Umezawaea sp.]